MLSLRSKVLLTIAIVVALFTLGEYIDGKTSWAKDLTADSYQEWIIAGVAIIVAIVSVVIDTQKKERS